tara:strand:- start:510 stop:713 length:204 start_codon:yes stop_codon:yes gene_type:complete
MVLNGINMKGEIDSNTEIIEPYNMPPFKIKTLYLMNIIEMGVNKNRNIRKGIRIRLILFLIINIGDL